MSLTFFTHNELACPRTRAVQLAPGFGAALDALRLEFGQAMSINSACRSTAHNGRIGGHPRSLHLIANPHWSFQGSPLDTCAVDVHTPDGAYRGRLIEVAWKHGWSIGIAGTFTHLDLRSRYTPLAQTTYLY